MKDEVLKISQTSVAQALAADYFCIYYVDVSNNKFIEYSSSPEYRAFGLPTGGDDFIEFSRKHFDALIFSEDQERFLETFTKDNIIAALDAHGFFTMTFRLMFGGVPTHVHLKVTRMIEQEKRHVVVGISSVDDQMKAREAFEKAHHARVTYSRIAQAMAGDYFCIYIVDPDTGAFAEYSATEQYSQLGISKAGEDFFGLIRGSAERLVFEGDRGRFLAVFSRERVLSLLERDGSFTTKFRLMFGGDPVYVSMKATLMDDEDGRHMIIGLNNIDAQIRREQEYQRKMADARTAAKNDFLANMSHDIRTPMNAIVGYTSIANSHLDDPAVVRDSLAKIGSSSHFLLSLINDILDISKIESGKMQLSSGPCDLAEVLRRIEDITALQAQNKSLEITYMHSGISHFKVIADELRIEQVLINILSNAIKYTPEGRSVGLVAEELPAQASGRNRYRFIVRDTGIGISEDYLPHIFESFTREQNTRLNRVQGTGLGLAITAKVVELMGGTIAVRSKVGEGSEFTVELELEPLGEAPLPSCEETTAADLAGHRVLLVEDNEINAEIATIILQQYGLAVDRARNGQEGVDKVRESGTGHYSVVLMDIQMPVMNGLEAAKVIRSLDGGRSLPIIALSANAYDDDVRDCLDAGMDAHLAKPFDPEDLAAVLGRLVLARGTCAGPQEKP